MSDIPTITPREVILDALQANRTPAMGIVAREDGNFSLHIEGTKQDIEHMLVGVLATVAQSFMPPHVLEHESDTNRALAMMGYLASRIDMQAEPEPAPSLIPVKTIH